jgi:hypothetical protein
MIKVGICVAYDWKLLMNSLPLVYPFADMLCLSIDRNRRSWSGVRYEFDETTFRNFISSIDKDRKIDVYEDDFSIPSLNALQNDSRQRTMMAKRMGTGGWYVQVDSDEYFLSFQSFIETLRNIIKAPSGNEKPVNVCASFIPLIKKTTNGYLFVDFKSRLPEQSPLATNVPQYTSARRNGHFNVVAPHYLIHETWARSEKDLKFKISNWGHTADDFVNLEKRESYFKLWQSLDEYNYQYIRDFHPGEPTTWPALNFCKGSTIEEFMIHLPKLDFPLNKFRLYLLNNRNVARFKSILKG